MTKNSGRHAWTRGFLRGLATVLIFAVSIAAAAGQKDKQKDKKKKDADNAAQAQPPAAPPTPDAEEIDHDIGEMLAGFQIGDVEMMHKYYADNVTFVSGEYEPPISGWLNYVPLYKRQRTGFQGMQLIRRNTVVTAHGDAAWASYQWEFLSLFNGQPYTAHGQTTLVFNKIGQNWLIVHNHTSEICAVAQRPTVQQPSPQRAPAPNPTAPGTPRS